jgi:hypothetical protein
VALTLVSANTSVAESSASGSTAASVTLNQPPVAGNILILQLAWSVQNSTANPTATPAGWTLIQDANGGLTNAREQLYWKQSDGTESVVSATLGAVAVWRMGVVEFTNGVPSNWFLDQSQKSTSSGSGTASTGTTAATTVANEVVLAALSKKNNDGFAGTGTAGYTVLDDDYVGSVAASSISTRIAYQIVSSTGAFSYSASNNGSRPHAGIIATFYAVAAAINYTDAPSGGIVLGGSAVQGKAYDDAQSGGIVLGGSASSTWAKDYAATPSGGIVLGGSAVTTWSRSLAVTPSGGIVLGGSAASDRTTGLAQTGGIVLGGSVVTVWARSITFTPSGGIVFGGAATITWLRAPTPSGGIVLGGTCVSSSSTANGYTDNPSGGIRLGGSVSISHLSTPVPSGGIRLGGTVTVTCALVFTTSGGIALGGSCTFSVVRAYTVSGGIQLGGTNTSASQLDLSRSGGLVLGGTVASDLSIAKAPSGGIILAGSISQSSAALPSGGIVLNGSVVALLLPPGPIYNNAPAGGIVLGGTCTYSQVKSYNYAPVGGIVFYGTAGTAGETVALPPISDRVDGGWTDQTGGQNLWDAIDEPAANDADYIKSTTSPMTADICEIAFESAVDPQSSTGHTLTYRYGSEAGGWTTVVQELTPAQADAITSYGTLGIRFEAKV